MSIDALIPQIDAARELGGRILLSWDQDREAGACMVLLSYPPRDWYWRRETDSPHEALKEGLAELLIVCGGNNAAPASPKAEAAA